MTAARACEEGNRTVKIGDMTQKMVDRLGTRRHHDNSVPINHWYLPKVSTSAVSA